MLITLIVCLTIINLIKGWKLGREAGSYYWAEIANRLLIENILLTPISLNSNMIGSLVLFLP